LPAPDARLLDHASRSLGLALAEAGALALSRFGRNPRRWRKSDGTPVSEADIAVDDLLKSRLTGEFPDFGWISEESVHFPPGGRSPTWIVDPIDGTRSFVRGVPLYGVMLALEEEGDVVVGVLHFPALAETVGAARGVGCWWNGRRALVSDETHLERALVCTTDVGLIEQRNFSRGWNRLRAHAGLVRTWGDCYGHALVATGRAEAMLDPIMSPWDAAALVPILEEAGGVLTDWHGESSWRNGSIVATNAALANDVRELLRETE
jgi:histidinol-phosphatase